MKHIYSFILLVFALGCRTAVKQQEDKIYSRHLQRHIPLTIISTRMPDDKSTMNLLLFNEADELKEMDAKEIIDSLQKTKSILPLVVVGIHGIKDHDYGITGLASAGKKGSKAEQYNNFVINELLPFIKKKTSVRKFSSTAIYGNSLAGISAFDIAWHNGNKIEKVGIASGNFDYAELPETPTDSSPNQVLQKINSSRKRPRLEYWFYAGTKEDSSILKNSQQLADIILKKNAGNSASTTFVIDHESNNIVSWRLHFAAFLLWAFRK